jgi:hypothetical protein
VTERGALSISEEWCSGGDLNPHALRHTPLKRTCLPFHHPSGFRGERTSNMAPIPRKDFFLPRRSLRSAAYLLNRFEHVALSFSQSICRTATATRGKFEGSGQ